jgi:hypothetical protein
MARWPGLARPLVVDHKPVSTPAWRRFHAGFLSLGTAPRVWLAPLLADASSGDICARRA